MNGFTDPRELGRSVKHYMARYAYLLGEKSDL